MVRVTNKYVVFGSIRFPVSKATVPSKTSFDCMRTNHWFLTEEKPSVWNSDVYFVVHQLGTNAGKHITREHISTDQNEQA